MRFDIRLAIMPLSALALTACGDAREEPTELEEAEAREQVETAPESIMRPDIEVESDLSDQIEPLERTIGFPDGGADLDDAAKAELRDLLEHPQIAEENYPIVLRGHSDSKGTDSDNLEVSRKRAEAVKSFLVDKGVDAGRLSVIALGENRPLRPNARLDGTSDEEARAANRRVELTTILPRSDDAGPDGDTAEAENAGSEEPEGGIASD